MNGYELPSDCTLLISQYFDDKFENQSSKEIVIYSLSKLKTKLVYSLSIPPNIKVNPT